LGAAGELGFRRVGPWVVAAAPIHVILGALKGWLSVRFVLVIISIMKLSFSDDHRHQDWKRRKEKKQIAELQNNIQHKRIRKIPARSL
jgi:transposase